MRKLILILSLCLFANILSQAQSNEVNSNTNFFSLDALSFLSNRLAYKETSQVDLKGSYLNTRINWGQRFTLRKNIFLTKRVSCYLGVGAGYSMFRFRYLSTHEFNDANDSDGPWVNFDVRTSTSGIEFASVLLGANYSIPLSERSQFLLSIGTNATYALNSGVGLSSGTTINATGVSKNIFRASMDINEENKIFISLDIGANYAKRFKNSHFGFKVGIGSSVLFGSEVVAGNIYLFGDEGNFVADVSSKLVFGGISVGLLYFPQKQINNRYE